MTPLDPNRLGPSKIDQPTAKPIGTVDSCICWGGEKDSLINYIEKP